MRSTPTTILLLAILWTTAVDSVAQNQDYSTLVLGVISTEASSQLRKGFDPFVKKLSENLDMPVKAYFATDYAGVIEAMRFNKIQIAWFGNKSAMEAVDRANGEVFAQITRVDGAQGYHSVLITQKESSLQSELDVFRRASELTFGNGDPNSTSGFLIPSYYLWAPKGIDPKSAFKRSRNANHEVNCLSVSMGQVDFATANTEALERFAVAHPKRAEKLRVIWTSPLIPNDPLVWRKDLPRELKSKIKGAILSFARIGPDAEEERALLANIQDGWAPFLDSDNQQLIPIREIALEKEIHAIRNNRNLDEEARRERIHKLEQSKRELIALQTSLEIIN